MKSYRLTIRINTWSEKVDFLPVNSMAEAIVALSTKRVAYFGLTRFGRVAESHHLTIIIANGIHLVWILTCLTLGKQ
jgi:hypothetical protein